MCPPKSGQTLRSAPTIIRVRRRVIRLDRGTIGNSKPILGQSQMPVLAENSDKRLDHIRPFARLSRLVEQ